MTQINAVYDVVSVFNTIGRIHCDYCGAYKGPAHISGPRPGATMTPMYAFSCAGRVMLVDNQPKSTLLICGTHKWEKDDRKGTVTVSGAKGTKVYKVL